MRVNDFFLPRPWRPALGRASALVPKPRDNLTRLHVVFAPESVPYMPMTPESDTLNKIEDVGRLDACDARALGGISSRSSGANSRWEKVRECLLRGHHGR